MSAPQRRTTPVNLAAGLLLAGLGLLSAFAAVGYFAKHQLVLAFGLAIGGWAGIFAAGYFLGFVGVSGSAE